MLLGHIIALIGAVMVAAGAYFLDWQTFKLAEMAIAGFRVPPAGQIVLGLGLLCGVTSILGILIRKKRNSFATATLIVGVFIIAWLLVAHVTRASAFDLQMHEIVNMASGYVLAAWGSLFLFLGPLAVFASEPRVDPNGRRLRVALIWEGTVLEERVLADAQTFTIGEDLRSDMIVPADKLPRSFPLFRRRRGGYEIGLRKEATGDVTINRETQPISDYIKKGTSDDGVSYVAIEDGDWGVVGLQEMQVFFQFIRPERRVGRRGLLVFDFNVAAALMCSFAIQVGFLLWTVFGWQESVTREIKLAKAQGMKIEVLLVPPEEETPEDGEEEDDPAKKAADEEGEVGDPEEDPEKETELVKLDAEQVEEIDPTKIGLNEILSEQMDNALSEVFADNALSLENKLAVAMAGDGATFRMGHGGGGMGLFGTGKGGGGVGGAGALHGQGTFGDGTGKGLGVGLGKKKTKKVGKLNLGGGSSAGFCKKNRVASLVKRRAGAIRACYEKRLQVKQDLSGKLTVQWTIGLTGKVTSVNATSNTLGDSQVSNCVLRIIQRIRFDKPEGGTCIIKWPFIFSA